MESETQTVRSHHGAKGTFHPFINILLVLLFYPQGSYFGLYPCSPYTLTKLCVTYPRNCQVDISSRTHTVGRLLVWQFD